MTNCICHEMLIYCQPDVTDFASFDALADQINEIVNDEGLNVIINNAGVFPNKDRSHSTRDDLMKTFEINSAAPVLLARVSNHSWLSTSLQMLMTITEYFVIN